jgi:hypothetical protein
VQELQQLPHHQGPEAKTIRVAVEEEAAEHHVATTMTDKAMQKAERGQNARQGEEGAAFAEGVVDLDRHPLLHLRTWRQDLDRILPHKWRRRS